jgi:hypothetical protein
MDAVEFDRDVLETDVPLNDQAPVAEDEGEDEDEELDDGPIPINRLTDVGTSTGYQTVTVEVLSWESPNIDSIARSGIVKDATGIIDVVAFDELSDAPDDPEDGRYLIEGVQVDEYEGDLQLVFDPRTTDWTKIQAGVGNLDHVSDESNQDLQSATDGGTAADTSDADTPSADPDDTASDDMASETIDDAAADSTDDTDDTDGTDDYVEPDSDLSDADWKETLLTIINVNGNSMHPDALHQAVIDHCDKESDDAADLIRNAADTGYLKTTLDMNWTSTSKLKGAVDAQTQDESG